MINNLISSLPSSVESYKATFDWVSDPKPDDYYGMNQLDFSRNDIKRRYLDNYDHYILILSNYTNPLGDWNTFNWNFDMHALFYYFTRESTKSNNKNYEYFQGINAKKVNIVRKAPLSWYQFNMFWRKDNIMYLNSFPAEPTGTYSGGDSLGFVTPFEGSNDGHFRTLEYTLFVW